MLFSFHFVGAQVGIGTATPAATLDVTALNPTGTATDVDGIIIPRVTRERAQSMAGTPTSTMIYVSEVVTGTAAGTTINVTTTGFYFFNGATWEKLGSSGVSNEWSIVGNSGLSGATNFLGTTDGVDVAFRRSNTAAGRIGSTSTSLGVGALPLGTATTSTAIGVNALAANTTGASNVAVGSGALAANSTSANSTAVGFNSMLVNTGGNNTALGYRSMVANSSGASNVAVGANALATNTTNGNNTAVGFNAMTLNTAAANTALGYRALATNSTASGVTAVGFNALAANTIGEWNTAVGFSALSGNSTGQHNVAIGYNALDRPGANPQQSVAIGSGALGNNTGNNNTAIGYNALSGVNTGIDNVAVGINTLVTNTSGQQNTAVGGESLSSNTTASFSTAFGFNAMRFFNGSQNTALGYQAGNGINATSSNGINNVFVGHQAGFRNTSGGGNVIMGAFAGDNNSTGGSNVFIGLDAGNQNTTGSNNIAIGANAGNATTTTSNNINIGFQAGNSSTGANNVNIGYQAGSSNTLGGNVNIGYQAGSSETTANKLYISNSNTSSTTSLIYGEFSPTRILRTNSIFQIGDPATTGYVFPAARGAVNQVLQTNGLGVLSWVNPSSLTITENDPQVSSVTNNAVPRWDGGTTTLVDGVITDDGTNVGVGTVPSVGNKLDVAGNTKTTNFQMTSGANPDYILQSDATGNASWVQNPLNTLSLVRVNLSANQSLAITGWQKVTFDTEIFDTNNEFDITTNRFTATKAGYYRINASFHTNDQSNGQLYSIGIRKNGNFYQQITANHHANGPVDRAINGLIYLAVGEYVEVFTENYQSGVLVDAFPGKTVFEIEQIR